MILVCWGEIHTGGRGSACGGGIQGRGKAFFFGIGVKILWRVPR